jgi:hypothetical protein
MIQTILVSLAIGFLTGWAYFGFPNLTKLWANQLSEGRAVASVARLGLRAPEQPLLKQAG